MTQVEGGVGCALYPCGTAAITNAILSFVQTGDHLLMVDTCYEPTRDFCDVILKKMGIETTYYDPLIGDDIRKLIRPETKILFTESPGSITMEVQDVPALAAIAHEHNIIVMLDNTWGAGVNFSPFEHGVDISVQAATKYIVGHSDVMLGTAVTHEKYWDQLREQSYLMGQCISPDDAYLGLRGLRTLDVRLKQHAKSSLTIARWLEEHPLVDHVRHPALESCPGHAFFKRDFKGGNGLFSFVLKDSCPPATTALLDSMKHFSMGYSWGGFESLILANEPKSFNSLRTVSNPDFQGTLIRLHTGLEDVNDLIADLEQGLKRYQEILTENK
jgi:cystathionine beta-lyase